MNEIHRILISLLILNNRSNTRRHDEKSHKREEDVWRRGKIRESARNREENEEGMRKNEARRSSNNGGKVKLEVQATMAERCNWIVTTSLSKREKKKTDTILWNWK
jgi:hypothetical protein